MFRQTPGAGLPHINQKRDGWCSSSAGRAIILLIVLGFCCLLRPPVQAWASGTAQPKNEELYPLEIRYRNPQAEEVSFVWGVNGWKLLAEKLRPAGTRLEKDVMVSPMTRDGDTFVIRLELPTWTTVNYGFLVTELPGGTAAEIWEGNGDQDFKTITNQLNTVIEIETRLKRAPVPEPAPSQPAPLVDLEVRYSLPEAGEVSFVWGIDGWKPVAEALQPEGTRLAEGVMKTPMKLENGLFAVRFQAPASSELSFGFLITRTRDGVTTEVWEADGKNDFHFIVTEDIVIEVEGKTTHEQLEAGKEGKDTAQWVSQVIRYRMPEASEVQFIWGINNWNVLPEAARPDRTVLVKGVMATTMQREGEVFTLVLQVPAGTTLNYGFLVTRDLSGGRMEAWEADGEVDFSTQVTADGTIEIESKLDFEPYRRLPALPRSALIVLVGLIPLTGLGLLLWFTARQPVRRQSRR